jgi:hypothetical protein
VQQVVEKAVQLVVKLAEQMDSLKVAKLVDVVVVLLAQKMDGPEVELMAFSRVEK